MSAYAPATLTISLPRLQKQYQLWSKKVRPAEASVVVKANAYGLGLAPIAKALAQAGCKSFFVATLEEGMALRKILPKATIYILNGIPTQASKQACAALAKSKLIPCLGSLEEIRLWGGTSKAPACLHIDTGMNRLGLSAKECAQLAQSKPAFPVALVMSHLADADNAKSKMNAQQRAQFETLSALLPPCAQKPCQ